MDSFVPPSLARSELRLLPGAAIPPLTLALAMAGMEERGSKSVAFVDYAWEPHADRLTRKQNF